MTVGLREPELKKPDRKIKTITSVKKDVSLKDQMTGDVYSVEKLVIIDEAGKTPVIVAPPELKDEKLSKFRVAEGKNVFGKPKPRKVDESPKDTNKRNN